MQTQTPNTLHNAIVEAGSKDRPSMLAPDKEIPISEGSLVTTTESQMETGRRIFKTSWKHGKSIIAIDEVLCFFWLSSGPLILLEIGGITNLALQGSSGSG
nr:hypothetical protein [Tanacetum cinerariifolium]